MRSSVLFVSAGEDELRASNRVRAGRTLAAYPIIEWITAKRDVDILGAALRKCRRRMLELGKDELDRALVRREFVLQYQPKVECSDSTEWKTREVEVLIRWRTRNMDCSGRWIFYLKPRHFSELHP
jgi:hypothetical protein